MNQPNAELVVYGEVIPVHDHQFAPAERQLELTTPQLRKLVFYQGPVTKCDCGAISIESGLGNIIYSRNGTRMS